MFNVLLNILVFFVALFGDASCFLPQFDADQVSSSDLR